MKRNIAEIAIILVLMLLLVYTVSTARSRAGVP